jgi:UDP-2,3-diacylglucosamine hydrolase
MGYKRMKKYLQIRFLNGFLVGCPILEFVGAIPIRKNKLISGDEDITFLGGQGMADSVFEEKTRTNITITSFFGHRHLPMKVSVGENSEYVNLGDWITYFTWRFDGKTSRLKIQVIYWDKYSK